jgi:hypothetical protein
MTSSSLDTVPPTEDMATTEGSASAKLPTARLVLSFMARAQHASAEGTTWNKTTRADCVAGGGCIGLLYCLFGLRWLRENHKGCRLGELSRNRFFICTAFEDNRSPQSSRYAASLNGIS